MANIGVVFGGKSGEYEISLISASNVISAIDKDKFAITLIGITQNGDWLKYTGNVDNIPNGEWINDKSNLREFSPLSSEANDIDIYFPILHGPFGEDGTIQGLFEMADKPYVGCGVLASALCMDKALAHSVMRDLGIPTVRDMTVTKAEILSDINQTAVKISNTFEYPIFVKPSNNGSSLGISKAKDMPSLIEALKEAALYDDKIICEEFAEGGEVESAILGNPDNPIFCGFGQIIPCNEFYDYDAKYISGESVEVIPAPISPIASGKVEEFAMLAYKSMGLSGLSRLDFFVNGDSVILNEINTMPGFTSISLYPKLCAYYGIPYPELVERLIALGFERYNQRKALKHKKG